ncbi:ATP-binding cassette domain-containing protein [Methylobacter sp.]|uniref:ATP-binding cassette domain-containing protein n=1 Tax=Methylobacter sp. TaxID=2051955 RepID=UPI0025D55479|nr:ATP-binding cassette domain-containing protein [Methylobacter sp.]
MGLIRPKLLDFIDIQSQKDKFLLASATVVSGIINALTLVILNTAAKDFDKPDLDERLFILFVLSVSLYLISKRYVTHRITELVQGGIFNYRGRILDLLRGLKLLSYEAIGKSQILSMLSEKTELISQGAHRLAEGFPAMVMLICSFIYMATISKMALAMALICIAGAMVTIYVLVQSISISMQQAMAKDNEYFAYMQHVLDGFNELKINREKVNDLYTNYMGEVSEEARQKNISTDISNVNLQLYAQLYFYILMASVVFLLPQLSTLTADKIMSITTIIFFIMGPIVLIIDMFPSLARANVAIDYLQRLESQLQSAQEDVFSTQETFIAPHYFDRILISQLYFSYPVEDQGRQFSVGPFDLSFARGELIFIRGGNGSGKSTFLKLLTGLYESNSGAIVVDNKTIDSELLGNYRNLFSIIFTDFHLFDRFYGQQNVNVEMVNEYLVLMGLEKKTGFKNGRFTHTNLSTGQKKRLALIIALLEDKAVYVFDEVAADQDPEFRQFFYDVILQKLKQKQKTVIVVTHDEKYFNHCDRLLVMDMGQMREEKIKFKFRRD